MRKTLDAGGVKTLAGELLRERRIRGDDIHGDAIIAEPLLVRGPQQQPHSWLVGLTAGDRLVSFFQILLDGTLMRYSSFERRAGDRSTCPPARDWLDPASVRDRAASQAQPEERVDEPVLTFDRTPDRLVWAVPLARADGRRRTLYVAGSSTYEPPDAPAFG